LKDTDMTALKIAIAVAALLALGGCIVEPYGAPAYYGRPAYYGNSGYYGGADVGVSVGGVNDGVSDAHSDGGRGHDGGDEHR
jgi:hypothetical protein